VTARGDHRVALFEESTDRTSFLKRYAEVVDRHRWIPLAYCLMGNHLHLVIETPERTLGLGARDLLSHFAKRHNARRDEIGHVFQGRFDSRLVPTDTYFAQLLRYLALNPVAAGICRAPQEWPWSNHRVRARGSVHVAATTGVVLRRQLTRPGDRRRARAWLSAGGDRPSSRRPRVHGVSLGSAGRCATVQERCLTPFLHACGVLFDDPPLHGSERRRLAALERRGRLVEREPGSGQDRADERRHVRPAHPGVTAVGHASEAR